MSGMDVSTLGILVKSDGVSQASSALSGLGTSAANAEKKVTSLTASVEKLLNVHKSATAQAQAYIQALQGANNLTGTVATATSNLSGITANLVNALNGVVNSLSNLSVNITTTTRNINTNTAAVQSNTGAMREAHDAARGLAGGLGALWLTYGNIAPMLAGVAISKGFIEATKAGAEFAYQLTFVKALGEETTETMERVSSTILTMSKGNMQGPVEMAQGMRILAQAGLSADEALKALPQALNLAVVGEMEMEKAAVTLTGVMNAFGLSVKDMPHIGDVFAKAAAVSQTSVVAMTESMKSASVVANQYGVNIEDTATALTLLAKVNITGSAAGTSFRNMLKEIYTPGKEASQMMQALGVKTADASGQLRPFANIIFDLKDKIVQFDKISQTQILQKLFGERGSKEAIAMLSLTKQKWDELHDSIASSEGFMQKVTSDLEETVKGKWLQAVNTFKTQLVESFVAIAPTFSKIADSLKTLFLDESFTGGLQNIVSLGASLVSVLVQMAPVLITLGKAWLAYKAAMMGAAAWTAITTAVTEFSAAMLAMSGAMGPTVTGMVGLRGVIAGLPALIGAIPTPLTIVAGLLAAGATAWVLWGDSASRAGDKAYDAAKRAEDKLKTIQNRQKYGVGDLGEARKELDDAEKLLQLRIEGRATGTALEDARNSVAKWEQIVNALEAEQYKAQSASASIANATAGTHKIGEILPKDKAAISDAWRAQLARIDGVIQDTNDKAKTAIAEEESLYKQGKIGEIVLLERKRQIESEAHQQVIAQLEKEINLAAPANRTAAIEKLKNEKARIAREELAQTAEKLNKEAEYYASLEQKNNTTAAEGFKARGEFLNAFLAENRAKYEQERGYLESNIKAETEELSKLQGLGLDPEAISRTEQRLAQLQKRLENINDAMKAGVDAAKLKETDYAAQAIVRGIEAQVQAIKAEAEVDGSLLSKWFNADKLSSVYAQQLTDFFALIKKEANEIAEIEADGGVVSSERRKAYNTRLVEYNKLVRQQRDIYKDFITDVDQIGSEGFRAFFDKTSGGWDSYLKKMKGSFKTLLLDEIYKMLARPIVLNLIANIAGAAGATGMAGSLSNAANAGSNLFSTGNSLYNAYNGGGVTGGLYNSFATSTFGQSLGLSTAATAIPGAVTGTGAVLNGTVGEFGFNALTNTMGGAALEGGGLTTLGSTIGTALPWIGAGLALVSLLSSSGLFGSGGAPKTNVWGVFNGSSSGLDVLHGNDRSGSQGGGESLAQAVYTDSVKAIVAKYAPSTTYTGFIGSQVNNKGRSSNQDFAYVSTTGLSSISGTSGDIYNNHNPDSGKGMEDFQKWVTEEIPRLQLAIVTDAFRKAGGGVKEIADSLMGTATDLTKTLDAMSGTNAAAMITQLNDLVTVYQTLHDTINPQITGAATVALVKLAGGVQNLTTSVDAYYNGYFSEAERMEKLSTKLTEQFKEMNLTVPTTREQFRKLVEGLDTSTAIGQQAFIKLMGLASSFGSLADYTASLTTAVEDFSEAIKTATETQNTLLSKYASSHQKYVDALKTLEDGFKALNLAVPTSAAEFYNIVKSADATTASGRALITALNQMAPAFDTVLEATKNRIQGRVDSANAGVEAAYNALQRAVDAEKAKVDAAYQKQVDAVGVAFKAAQDAAETQIKAANDTKSAITSLASTLNSAVKSVGTDINVLSLVQRSEAIKALETAAKAGSTGNSLLPYSQSITDAIETLSKPSEDLYSDFVSYSRDQHKANNVLTSLNDSASAQKSVAELTLDALTAAKDQAQVNNDALLKTLSDNHETQIKDLDDQLNAAKTMIDVMNGVDVSVKSVADAVRALAAAMAIAKSANAAAGVGAVQNLSGMSTQDIIDRGTSLGQSSSEISSVVKAVDQINTLQNTDLYWAAKQGTTITAQQLASQLAPGWNPSADALAYWNNQIATQGGAQAVAQFLNPTDPNAARNKYLTNSHATGLERVPYDNYPAWLHEGEAVVDANSVKAIERYFGVDVSKAPSTVNNVNSRNASEYSELCNEVKQLRAEQQAALIAIAQSSGRTAKQLERWDGDGIPDTRVV